jgi:hypothetical protein
LLRNQRVSALIAGARVVVTAVHCESCCLRHGLVCCCVTGLPLHLRQCCVDSDIDALDAALDDADEATAIDSVRAAAALNSVGVLRRLHGRLGRSALMRQDARGQSALHWACLRDAVDCVRYLVQHAPESATIQDAEGES